MNQQKPRLVCHETSPAIALDILRTRRTLGGPLRGDGGLNLIAPDSPGQYGEDQAAARGAILTFEWSGVTELDSPRDDRYTYPPDVLYDQPPHRLFVPVGSSKHLTLIDAKLIGQASWADAVAEPSFSLLAPGSWTHKLRADWVGRQAAIIEVEVKQILGTRPNVRVALPPYCTYASQVMTLYPNGDWRP